MKQCPVCKGIELYDDAQTNCPHCNSELVPYTRTARNRINNNNPANPVRPNTRPDDRQRQEDPVFERDAGKKLIYRGIVTSISPTSHYESRFTKWINAVFRGQPYQLGNPVYETIVRIEEINRSRIPEQMRNFVYYGELNELDIGDDVTITAKRSSNRLEIKGIVINDVDEIVKPHNQLSGIALKLLSLLIVILIIFLVSAIISLFTSGGIWKLLSALVGGALSVLYKLIAVLAPIIVLILIYWFFFKRK